MALKRPRIRFKALKPPKGVSAYLAKIGRLGGLVRNPTRTAALAKNLEKARSALAKKRLATKSGL